MLGTDKVIKYTLTGPWNNIFEKWGGMAFHPAALGSSPKHTIYSFINWLGFCRVEKTKINKKEAGIGRFNIFDNSFENETQIKTRSFKA